MSLHRRNSFLNQRRQPPNTTPTLGNSHSVGGGPPLRLTRSPSSSFLPSAPQLSPTLAYGHSIPTSELSPIEPSAPVNLWSSAPSAPLEPSPGSLLRRSSVSSGGPPGILRPQREVPPNAWAGGNTTTLQWAKRNGDKELYRQERARLAREGIEQDSDEFGSDDSDRSFQLDIQDVRPRTGSKGVVGMGVSRSVGGGRRVLPTYALDSDERLTLTHSTTDLQSRPSFPSYSSVGTPPRGRQLSLAQREIEERRAKLEALGLGTSHNSSHAPQRSLDFDLTSTRPSAPAPSLARRGRAPSPAPPLRRGPPGLSPLQAKPSSLFPTSPTSPSIGTKVAGQYPGLSAGLSSSSIPPSRRQASPARPHGAPRQIRGFDIPGQPSLSTLGRTRDPSPAGRRLGLGGGGSLMGNGSGTATLESMRVGRGRAGSLAGLGGGVGSPPTPEVNSVRTNSAKPMTDLCIVVGVAGIA